MSVKKFIDWDSEPLGKTTDIVIARRLGVHPSAVQKARALRGIQSFRPKHTPPVTIASRAATDAALATLIVQLAKRGTTIEQLSDDLDMSPRRTREAVEALREDGYSLSINDGTVGLDPEPRRGGEHRIDIAADTDGVHRFGVVSDTHLGSKYERLDVLNALYDEFERQGVERVYLAGNYIDGEKPGINTHDLHARGMDAQLRYFIDHFPARKGVTTCYVGGDDHEGWYTQREGIDVGAHLQGMARQAGREDLVYLGYMEADVIYRAPSGETVVRVIHGGGGSAYAVSYQPQKIVESLSGGEKPNVLIVGHYHKAEYLYTRGVHVLQAGCTQDQTPFMRKKRLAAHLGGWICEMGVNDSGTVVSFRTQLFPFYDRAYHERRWRYQHTGQEGFD